MSKLKQCVATGIPAMGLFAMLVYMVMPIVYYFPDVGAGVESILFGLASMHIFKIPILVWISLAFISYGIGFVLFRIYVHSTGRYALFILSEALMWIPPCIVVLFISVGQYHGP